MAIFSLPISFPVHFLLYTSCVIKFIAKKHTPVFTEMEVNKISLAYWKLNPVNNGPEKSGSINGVVVYRGIFS